LKLACHLAAVSETTLTVYPQQLWQRVVSGIAMPSSLVERVYMKVGSGELIKGDGFHTDSIQKAIWLILARRSAQ
jgi:hypothetical protein